MEINYSKFKTLPCCKHCNIKLVDDSIWNKYRLRKKFVGDRFALKDYELYGKIYNRKICETCLSNDSLKNNMILERKFLLFIVWETYLKFENFIKYFYNSTLKGYINERKNNR